MTDSTLITIDQPFFEIDTVNISNVNRALVGRAKLMTDIVISKFRTGRYLPHQDLIYKSPQVYLLRCSNSTESFLKVGLSATFSRRKEQIPYKVTPILVSRRMGNIDAHIIEKVILMRLVNQRHLPKKMFSGRTECIADSIDNVELIKRIMVNTWAYVVIEELEYTTTDDSWMDKLVTDTSFDRLLS